MRLFSSHRLRQRIYTVYPTVYFFSRSSSSCIGDAINGGMKLRTRSEENLNKLSDCMDNMDDDVSKLFMEYNQTDFSKDPELLRLLNDYFTTTRSVSELCESLRNCLQNPQHDECLLMDEALRDFEEEKSGYGGLLEASFRKTLRDLRSFNDGHCDCGFLAGDFLRKTQICYEDLVNMIVELETTMKKIDKNLRRVRGRRAIITAALLAPLIAVMVLSKIIAGIFGFVPLDAVTKLASWRWKKSTEGLKREKTAMTSMERGTMVALKEVKKISKLVNRLENVERSIRLTAESAVKKRSSVAVAMCGMEEERKRLKSTIVDLDKETERCDEFAKFGRTVAREKIVEFLSRGEKCLK